jgi:BASS family bile acid:Na+ symporter
VETRRVLALGTASRNFAAALVVAGQSFDDAEVVVTVIVVAILSMLFLIPLSRVLAKRRHNAQSGTSFEALPPQP